MSTDNGKTRNGPPKPFDPSLPRRDSSWWGVRLALLRVVIIIAIFFSIRYFYWRATETQNYAALWFFYLFLVAEIVNFFEVVLFYFIIWRTRHYAELPPLEGKSVDVFITTFNEPVELLRETVVCAVSIRYPHKTHLLDDGNRPEVRELAREFDCGYIARTERTNAKAGNLNNALKHTDGEFIVTLDADHVPSPELIDSMIGFFASANVAIVQATQDFYNLDSFQHLTDWRTKFAWQQQELFFGVIQPGRAGYNAVYYCGSPAMLRRKALEEIGGFATETITEDVHTGLRLQKRGYEVVYFNRTLARGLAPQTFSSFATQWQRWGVGAMQVLRLENPVFGRGLTLGQRLAYFCGFYFFWTGYQRMIYVLTPIFALLTGIFPLVAEPIEYLYYFGFYFLLNSLASASLQGGLRDFLFSEEFNLLKMHVMMKSLGGFFRRKRDFKVTPKARHGAPVWTEIWPQVAIIVGSVLAIFIGWQRLLTARSDFDFWALVVNLFWASFFLITTASVAWRALTRKELRMSYRFPSQLDVPVTLSFDFKGGAKTDKLFARNLNRFGFSVTCDYAIPPGTKLEADMVVMGKPIKARAVVMRNQEVEFQKKKLVANGIRFDKIDAVDQDQISKYLFWEVAPRHNNILRLTKLTQTQEPNA
ncbi:MAG: glycosyltransferase [Acidobacteria bacterium]|nr:glycosyltransferase [Acidobacteriota bacterium]